MGQNTFGESIKHPPELDIAGWFVEHNIQQYGWMPCLETQHKIILSTIIYSPLTELPPEANEELYQLAHRSVLAEKESMATMVTSLMENECKAGIGLSSTKPKQQRWGHVNRT